MDDNQLLEQFVDSRPVFDGVIIHVEHWNVRLPNGDMAVREVAVHPGASAVVALDDDGNVLMVRQHRIAVGRVTLEIPAGKKDSPDEDPLVTARRELSEETGCTAENWRELTALDTTPGFCTECIHLYLATGLKAGASHPDEDEFVSVTRLPLEEAFRLVMNGTIRDAKTCMGILMAHSIVTNETV